MNFEETLKFVEATLEAKTGKPLTSPEKGILKAAWDNETYSNVADSLYLSVGYIKDLASLLWQRLSEAFGEKITKNNFRLKAEAQNFKLRLSDETIEENSTDKDRERKGTIFVVDDVIENLILLTRLLSKHGYKVRSAKNGKMALTAIRSNHPDIILLDIVMPEMDGYAVCKALKDDEDTSEIPIIFLSALDGTIDKVKAFSLGGADYINKPIEIEEAIARIQSQIIIKQQKIQLKQQIERHQQTVEILYQSRALLASLLNSSKDGIAAVQAVRDPITEEINDFRCLVVNPIFAKLFGQKREDFMGKSTLKDLFFRFVPTLFDTLVKVTETRESIEQELYWENDDRQNRYYVSIVKFGDFCSITVRSHKN